MDFGTSAEGQIAQPLQQSVPCLVESFLKIMHDALGHLREHYDGSPHLKLIGFRVQCAGYHGSKVASCRSQSQHD